MVKNQKSIDTKNGNKNTKVSSVSYEQSKLKFLSHFSNELLRCNELKEIYKLITETTREKLCCRTSSIFLFTKQGKLKREYVSGFKTSHLPNEIYERG